MYNPTSFFRKSFIQAFFIATIPFIFQRIANYFYLVNLGDNIEMNAWLINSVYSFLLVGLFGMVLPWMSIIFSSEMLYTRSLGRKELFKIILVEYLKWFIPITILVLLTVAFSYSSLGSSSSISYPECIALSSITFFLSLILAGNSKLAFKMLKFGLPVLGLIAFYGDLPLPYAYRNEFSGLAWFTFLSYYFYKIYTYNEDLDLNVPGRPEDENRSIAGFSLFSKEFASSDIKLFKSKNSILNKLNTIKLIVSDSSNIYLQITFLMLTISFIISLKYLYNLIFLDRGDYIVVLNGLLIFTTFILVLVNPKYLILNREEFLLSRGTKRSEIYLFNWLNQGLFISFVSLITLATFKPFENSDLLLSLDTSKILIYLFWTYISGEIGLLLMFLFLILDLSSYLISNVSLANLFISSLTNMQSLNLSGLLMWFLAFSLRYYDFYRFNSKDIGFFKGIKSSIKNVSYSYIIPSILSVFLIFFGIVLNPLTKFMSLSGFDPSKDHLVRKGSFLALLFNSADFGNFNYDYTSNTFSDGIKKLIKDSNNKEGYLDLANSYLSEITYQYDNVIKNAELLDKEDRFEDKELNAIFLNKAKNLLELGKDEKSVKYIETLFMVNLLDKDYNSAEKNLLKLLEIDNNIRYKLSLASLYKHTQKNDKALEIYKSEGQNKPKILSLYYQLKSDLHENNKEHKNALNEYVTAYKSDKTIYLPRANYFSNGLCSDLKNLDSNYGNDGTDFSKSIKNYLSFCENGIYLEKPRYLHWNMSFYYGFLKKYYFDISNEYVSYLLDKNQEKTVEEKIIKNYSWSQQLFLNDGVRVINPSNIDSFISKYIKKGDLITAKNLLDKALRNQDLSSYFYSKRSFNPNLYLLKLELEFKNENDPALKLDRIEPTDSDKKEIEKFNSDMILIRKRIGNIPDAKRFLLTSNNIEESFNILTKKFKFSKNEKDELNKLVFSVKEATNSYNESNNTVKLKINDIRTLKHYTYINRDKFNYLLTLRIRYEFC
jgi:hypothetical protein